MLAEQAFAGLPEQFRNAVGQVEFRVLDFADDATLDFLGIEDPFELSGLYHGVDLIRRSQFDPLPKNSEISIAGRSWTNGPSGGT